MASLDIQPGISDQMIEFFKLKVKTMSVQELLSLLSADEVSLKIWFDVNPQHDLVEGYEDYGKYGRTKSRLTMPSSSWSKVCHYLYCNLFSLRVACDG